MAINFKALEEICREVEIEIARSFDEQAQWLEIYSDYKQGMSWRAIMKKYRRGFYTCKKIVATAQSITSQFSQQVERV